MSEFPDEAKLYWDGRYLRFTPALTSVPQRYIHESRVPISCGGTMESKLVCVWSKLPLENTEAAELTQTGCGKIVPPIWGFFREAIFCPYCGGTIKYTLTSGSAEKKHPMCLCPDDKALCTIHPAT